MLSHGLEAVVSCRPSPNGKPFLYLPAMPVVQECDTIVAGDMVKSIEITVCKNNEQQERCKVESTAQQATAMLDCKDKADG